MFASAFHQLATSGVRAAASGTPVAAAAAATWVRAMAAKGIKANVLRYHEHGAPKNVLKLEQESIPDKVSGSEVLVQMLAAPMNPSDINMIQGVYGTQTELPAVGGNEGVGVVLKVGDKVKGIAANDWVIPAGPGFGTWRSHAVVAADQLTKFPTKNIPAEYAATLAVNPCTALRLLSDFGGLSAGDVVVQNGANSAVGHAVVQLAKKKGIRTVNIIRERPDFDEISERLKDLGGDGTIVVGEQYAATPEMKRVLADVPAPKLGLNCVGGKSATSVARLLGKGATLVTYGGMAKKGVTVSTAAMVFNDLTLKGFWLTEWNKHAGADARAAMLDELVPMVEAGELKLWMEKRRLSDVEGNLSKLGEPYRSRKIVLDPSM